MKYEMTFYNEIGRGKTDSRLLHLPSATSGITIGPGYDMKHRTEEEIYYDLKVGCHIPKRIARAISKGAELTGAEALEFISKNKNIKITDEQEKDIFDFVILKYIDRSKYDYNKLNIPNKPDYNSLPQLVKELLVDYSYNVGVRRFPSFFTAIICGDKKRAYKEYVRYTGGVPLGRRNKDTKALLDTYDFKDLRI